MIIEIKVARKSSTGEWVVIVWENGNHKNDDNDYFTDDKQDADLSAINMVRQYYLNSPKGTEIKLHLKK